jgi:U32 family peptidase
VNSPAPSPELLLPAGGFDSAIAAIEGGADALYLGFAEFSARKQARNFDRLEYRRLHRFAREKGVRLYVTINTILLHGELEGAAALLAFLGRFPPDAVLVQDWGLAALIRDRHPGIAIHASTQAAVQGSAAARIARELGASRVVLPRETSLHEMARLHEEEPGIEYEAFVHGALCYSFSGLCLASGLVLGRSGNRGDCAQLCRSYYDAEGFGREERGPRDSPDERGRSGYWFSCRDLELGGRVGELAAAGICSFKVEGRMKSPEYCYAVARYYRGLIDRLKGAGPVDAELEARLRAARTTFSRSPTEGWLFERGGAALIDSAYPGHRGVSAGRIVQLSGVRLILDLSSDLGLHDGLLGFERGDQSRPQRFPALELRDSRSGRELVRAKAGARVEIEVRLEGGRAPDFRPGDELYRISSRELDRKAVSPEEFEPEREELGARLRAGTEGLGAELELPTFDGRRALQPAETKLATIEAGGALPFDLAKSAGGFERALALFAQSGDADFRLIPSIEREAPVELHAGPDGTRPSCATADLFLPPSALKREKNRIYARAAQLVSEAELAYARESVALRETASSLPAGSKREEPTAAPPRAALVFPRDNLPSGMPFATPRDLVEGAALPQWGGRSWLPLAPLVADRDGYALLVRDRVRAALEGAPGRSGGAAIVVGIGALHHFGIARDLMTEHPDSGDRLAFFLDFGLYVANDWAYASLASLLPRVEFAYRYIEAAELSLDGGESRGPRAPSAFLAPIGPGFEPPLFQSFGCFLKHHVLGGSCPEHCARSWSTALADRDRRYRILVEDCVTMLFRLIAT